MSDREKKVTFSEGALPIPKLVEWCPFCGERIHGGHHQGTCELCKREVKVKARAKYCPLCGLEVVGPHTCPDQ